MFAATRTDVIINVAFEMFLLKNVLLKTKGRITPNPIKELAQYLEVLILKNDLHDMYVATQNRRK